MIEKIPLQTGTFHIHNLAMRSMIVSATNLTKVEKKEIRELVSFMGAIYIDALRDTVTHLISKTVVSS